MGRRNWLVIGCLVVLTMAVGCRQTETSLAVVEPIPGWEKFEGRGIEFWLPESYEGGSPSEKLDVFVENVRALGPDFEKVARAIEKHPSAFVIMAVDSNVGPTGALTNVNVTTELLPSSFGLNAYLDRAIQHLPRQIRLIERKLVSLDAYQAGRLVLEFEAQNLHTKQIAYVIKDGSAVWVVTYTTGADEFDHRLAVFEQSIHTFKVRAQPLWGKVLGMLLARLIGT